jgi:predicted Zn-dependent protease
MKTAVSELKASLLAEPDNLDAYRQLSQAYGRTGDVGNAELTMAEGYFRAGNKRDAQVFAARAQMKLPKGTPAWRRANDILTVGK